MGTVCWSREHLDAEAPRQPAIRLYGPRDALGSVIHNGRRQKRPECAHTYVEYYSAIKRNKVRTQVTTWKRLENVMLSEISQNQK